jgi:hypothetical protein
LSNYLKPLSEIKSPDLIEYDRDSLVQEVIERIQADPNWSTIWDGELLHNFSYFIINTFSYLFSKNAETANRVLRETFITQAKDPLSIVNYLSNFSLNLKQNTASMAEITVRPNDGSSFSNKFYLNAGFPLTATTINNTNINYELYNLEVDDNGDITGKIDYRSPITIDPQNFIKVNGFSGTTITSNFDIDPITQTEKFIYNINDSDIIENSIRIYYEYNTLNEVELIETDSFVITPKIVGPFTEVLGGVPHYKIKYNTDGSAQIIFGSREFGGSFPSNGGNITIVYRVGGGSLSNISRGGVNSTINLPIDNYTSIDVNFYNFIAGGGGGDRENLDEAQFYAPYRIGRGRSIIDDTDALNEIRNSVIKHKVKSPKYNGTNIPLLHYHNLIVPVRNFLNFRFPIPDNSDTYITYKEILELELNKFLNIDGIHDGAENDIIITFFRNSDFAFPLPYKPPLNGSLYVSAYDSNGKEVDRLIWGSNYAGQINFPNVAAVKASTVSTSVIGTTSISEVQPFLYFNIDDIDGNYTLADGTKCFRVALDAETYTLDITTNKNDSLANEIDSKIRSMDTYYSSFPTSTPFAYINNDKKLVITSLSTGTTSSVQLYNFSDSVLRNAISSLQAERVDASPQNRKVFLETSNYNYEIHEVNIKLNTDFFRQKNFQNVVTGWENPEIATGPIITLSLTDENNDKIFLQEGTDLVINSVNDSTTVDTLTFSNISSTSTNFGKNDTGEVFDDSLTNACYYNYSTGEIVVKLINSNLETPDYSFPIAEDGITELYNANTIFNVQYFEKTFNLITVSMTPHPYFGEGEAQSFLYKLRNKDKKMIGIEPLLKKVNFKPILLEIEVTPNKGYSREQAIQNTLQYVYNNFSYSTMVPEISIGSGFNIRTIESYLNNKTILPSVERVKITIPNDDIIDANDSSYYFIFDESFMSRIKQLETTYTQLSGLYDSYKLRVKIT